MTSGSQAYLMEDIRYVLGPDPKTDSQHTFDHSQSKEERSMSLRNLVITSVTGICCLVLIAVLLTTRKSIAYRIASHGSTSASTLSSARSTLLPFGHWHVTKRALTDVQCQIVNGNNCTSLVDGSNDTYNEDITNQTAIKLTFNKEHQISSFIIRGRLKQLDIIQGNLTHLVNLSCQQQAQQITLEFIFLVKHVLMTSFEGCNNNSIIIHSIETYEEYMSEKKGERLKSQTTKMFQRDSDITEMETVSTSPLLVSYIIKMNTKSHTTKTNKIEFSFSKNSDPNGKKNNKHTTGILAAKNQVITEKTARTISDGTQRDDTPTLNNESL